MEAQAQGLADRQARIPVPAHCLAYAVSVDSLTILASETGQRFACSRQRLNRQAAGSCVHIDLQSLARKLQRDRFHHTAEMPCVQ